MVYRNCSLSLQDNANHSLLFLFVFLLFLPLGVVVLDSPQDPVPVSSVSVVPPPPPKNAARMLALALAESAQQASAQSNRKPDALSDCITYAETESRETVEMFHPYSGVSPEKLHLYAALPENPLSFQAADHHRSGLPVDQGFPNSGVPEGSNCSHASTPGNWDHSLLPPDMPGELQRGTDMGWDHSHFHPRMSGETYHPTHSVLSEGQNYSHPCARGATEPEPPTTKAPPQNPHLHGCVPVDKNQIQTNKLHFPVCTMENKYQFISAMAGEKAPTTVAAYVTAVPTTAAETEPGSQHIPLYPAAATPNCTWGEIALMTAQHALAANHAVPTQRQGEHQPAMGQAPVTAIKPSSCTGQVKISLPSPD